MHGLRKPEAIQAAVEWLLECGWFEPHAKAAKTGGRPRSDYIVAPTLWPALDERARQKRQNGETYENIHNFGCCVAEDEAAAKPNERSAPTEDCAATNPALHPGVCSSLEPVIQDTIRTTALQERRSDEAAGGTVLSILDSLIAKKGSPNT